MSFLTVSSSPLSNLSQLLYYFIQPSVLHYWPNCRQLILWNYFHRQFRLILLIFSNHYVILCTYTGLLSIYLSFTSFLPLRSSHLFLFVHLFHYVVSIMISYAFHRPIFFIFHYVIYSTTFVPLCSLSTFFSVFRN